MIEQHCVSVKNVQENLHKLHIWISDKLHSMKLGYYEYSQLTLNSTFVYCQTFSAHTTESRISISNLDLNQNTWSSRERTNSLKSWLTLDVFPLQFFKSKYCHDFIISEIKKMSSGTIFVLRHRKTHYLVLLWLWKKWR